MGIIGATTVAAFTDRPRTIAVDSLAEDGTGSLRACAEAREKRVCRFDVAGAIALSRDIRIEYAGIEIRGETAPSPGVTVVGAGIVIKANDVRISHLRVRPGDDLIGPDPENRDAVRVETGSHRVALDHVSAERAVDENIDVWGSDIADVTISNSIIGEALDSPLHPKGPHSKGLLVGSESMPPQRVAIVGNLFVGNRDRNPLVHSAFIANNVIADWDIAATHIRGSTTPAVPSEASVIGNIYLTPRGADASFPLSVGTNLATGSRIFVNDNVLNAKAVAAFIPDRYQSREIMWIPDGYAIRPSAGTLEAVLEGAGARPDDRDAIDRRIVEAVRSDIR